MHTGTQKVELNYHPHKSWGYHYGTVQDETQLYNDDAETARKAEVILQIVTKRHQVSPQAHPEIWAGLPIAAG